MFVMHFMRPPDRTNVGIIWPAEPFEPLVYDYIMYKKISGTIGHNAKSNRLQPVNLLQWTKQEYKKTWNCENDEESVVLFKKPRSFFMMVLVKVPQEAMHYVAMGEPGDTFHNKEGE